MGNGLGVENTCCESGGDAHLEFLGGSAPIKVPLFYLCCWEGARCLRKCMYGMRHVEKEREEERNGKSERGNVWEGPV